MKTFAAILAAAGLASAQSLAEVIAQNNSTLSTLASLVTSAGLLDTLASARGITILAPTNDAFTKFTSENEAAIRADPGLVKAVLEYHVLNGSIPASAITSAGKPLFPRSLLSNTTYAKVDGGQFVEASGSGSKVTFTTGLLSKSNVVTANVNFTGGIVHVIDKVLTVPQNVTSTALSLQLTSLAGALTQTRLLSTVEELSNVTIFAPSNRAFQNIASVLSNATNETVSSVLTYHVVPGAVIFSTDLTDGAKLKTVNGAELTIRKVGDNFFVNNALIATPNVLVKNGVVHVIDEVLNPGNSTAAPPNGATAGAVGFEGAKAGSEAPLTSGLPSPATTVNPSGVAGATNASTSAPARSTGGAAQIGVPLAGALAGLAAFLL